MKNVLLTQVEANELSRSSNDKWHRYTGSPRSVRSVEVRRLAVLDATNDSAEIEVLSLSIGGANGITIEISGDAAEILAVALKVGARR